MSKHNQIFEAFKSQNKLCCFERMLSVTGKIWIISKIEWMINNSKFLFEIYLIRLSLKI
jgi:hypothetical protein